MSKKTERIGIDKVEEALSTIRDVLIADGAMLPVSIAQLTKDDLVLFGKGRAVDIGELQRRVEAMGVKTTKYTPLEADNPIPEAMAMAARNGDQISEAVLARMMEDRRHAEEGDDEK